MKNTKEVREIREIKETKETRPVSFRLPAEIFDALQEEGEKMGLSAHELASKRVQENHQAPFEAIVLKEPVTCGKEVFQQTPSKRVFHFTMNDLKSICLVLSGEPLSAMSLSSWRIGDEWNDLKRIGDDLWELTVSHSQVQYK